MTIPDSEHDGHDDTSVVGSNEDNDKGTGSATRAVSLCKSFRAQYVHGTFFTGGKVIITSTRQGIGSLHNYKHRNDEDKIDDDSENETKEPETNNAKENVSLLALCAGDVSMIDTNSGIQTHTIRTGVQSVDNPKTDIATYSNNNGDDQVIVDDDEDEMLDMDSILNFALSPSDQILVTSSRNNLMRIYNLSSSDSDSSSPLGPGPSNIVQTVARAHEAPIKAMEFHPSNAFLVTGAVDGVVKVWDMRAAATVKKGVSGMEKMSGACFVTHCYRIGAGIVGGVSALAWAPKMRQFDASMGQMSISTPTGIGLAMGFENGRVDVVDLMHSTTSSSSKKHHSSSSGNENGQDLTTTQTGGVVVIGGMEAHVSAVTDMAWAGGKFHDNFFITVGRDEVVNIWNIEIAGDNDEDNERKNKKRKKVIEVNVQKSKITYRRIFTHPIYEHIESMKILYSSSSSIHLATAGSKGCIRVWDVTTSSDKNVLGMECIHTQSEEELPFGDTRGGYTRLLLDPSSHNFSRSNINDENKQIIAVDAHHNFTYFSYKRSSDDQKKKIEYNLQPGRTIVGYNDEIIDLKVLSPHNKIAVATNSPQLRLFDFSQNSFSCYSTLNGHKDIVLCMDVSADGFWIASAGKDRSMILWDAEQKRYVTID